MTPQFDQYGNQTFQTYRGWKRNLEKRFGKKNLSYDGNKDICQAFSEGIGVGEWDGEKGYVEKENVPSLLRKRGECYIREARQYKCFVFSENDFWCPDCAEGIPEIIRGIDMTRGLLCRNCEDTKNGK